MKKVNLDAEGCPEYLKDTKDFGGEVKATCVSCYYLLFAVCFIDEAKKRDRILCMALEGWNEQAKRVILERVEQMKRKA